MSQESRSKGIWRQRVKRLAAIGGAAALMGAAIVPISSSAAVATPPTTYNYTVPSTSPNNAWAVPAGVNFVEVTVRGGSGGNSNGGLGGVVTGILDVSSISSLRLYVASSGGDGDYGGGGNSWGNAGSGYGYGGRGGSGSVSPVIPSASQGGGGGGGASAVAGGGSLLIVAGGGGGGGGDAVCEGNPGGGAGQNGWKESSSCASAGGDPGIAGAASDSEGLQGNNAGSSSGQGGGGGGGGGYRGGSGAHASTDGGGGGGGGSSFCAAGNCSASSSNFGNGSIQIRPIHTPVVTFDQASYAASTGNSITFSGSVATEAVSGGVPEGEVVLSIENEESESHEFVSLPVNAQGKFSFTCDVPCGAGIADVTQVRASYQSNNLSSWQNTTGTAPLAFINAETQTQLFIDPSLAVTGQLRDFTATVQVLQPGSGAPLGDVEFWMSNIDGSDPQLFGTAPLAPNYQASLAAGVQDAKQKRFWAVYSGSVGFNGSQSPKQSLTTEQAKTNTVAVTVPQPTVTGEAFEMHAAVTALAPGAGLPTGDIEVIGESGTQTVTLDAAGEAVVPLAGKSAGEYEYKVNYLGDANFLPSYTEATHTVDRAAVDLDLLVSSPISEYGEEVVLSASAAVIYPGAGEIIGNVQFGYLDDESDFIAIDDPVALDEETAKLTLTGLDVGAYVFQAQYLETASFLAAASPLAEHEVFQAAPTVNVTLHPETTTYGMPQLATITVVGPDYAAGDPLPADGTVQLIFVDEDGAQTPFGDPALLNEAGVAVVDLAWLDPANYTIYAIYDGSNNYLPGESENAEFMVEEALPHVTLSGESSAANTESVAGEKITVGQTHTFTIEVAAYADSTDAVGDATIAEVSDMLTLSLLLNEWPGRTWLDFIPTGKINLLIDDEVIAADVALRADADGRMVAVAAVTHTFANSGSYFVAAEYSGDDYVLSGTSNSIFVQVSEIPDPPLNPTDPSDKEPSGKEPSGGGSDLPVQPEKPGEGGSAGVEEQPRPGLAQTGFNETANILGFAFIVTLMGVALLLRQRSRKSAIFDLT